MVELPEGAAPTPDPGRYVPIRCPSCASTRFEITYDDALDAHLYRCAGCGTPLVLKRLRDLD